MLIANPAYDVVFKYLLDDKKIAKKLISLIIGEQITKLELQPTELKANNEDKKDNKVFNIFSIIHMDFAATIKLPDGKQKKIIIELQKARFSSDIKRFRRYLGCQYDSANNYYYEGKRKIAMPVFTIYFLGNYLEHTKVPLIRVNRTYHDITTGEIINKKEEFIESLTHDSIIIQIPALKTHRRNRLEKVLSIFEAGKNKPHCVDVSEEDYPEEFQDLIRRLKKAAATVQIREYMTVEEDYINDFQDVQQELAEEIKGRKKDKQALKEKDQALEEKDQALEEKDQALEGKDKIIEALIKAHAKSKNISIAEARKILIPDPGK